MGDLATAMEISSAVIAEYASADRRRDYEALCIGFVQMVYCRTLPPDDAYHWTRIVVYDAKRLALMSSSLCD